MMQTSLYRQPVCVKGHCERKRHPLWRQIQADVFGREVELVKAEEGAAYGAALLAGVGAKIWPTVEAACEATVETHLRVVPNADNVSVLRERYEAYKRLHPALRTIEGD